MLTISNNQLSRAPSTDDELADWEMIKSASDEASSSAKSEFLTSDDSDQGSPVDSDQELHFLGEKFQLTRQPNVDITIRPSAPSIVGITTMSFENATELLLKYTHRVMGQEVSGFTLNNSKMVQLAFRISIEKGDHIITNFLMNNYGPFLFQGESVLDNLYVAMENNQMDLAIKYLENCDPHSIALAPKEKREEILEFAIKEGQDDLVQALLKHEGMLPAFAKLFKKIPEADLIKYIQ